MDLSSVLDVATWHKESKEEHSGGGLFLVLPHELGKQIPKDGKEGKDESPPHITLIYIDDVKQKQNKEKEYIDAIKRACSQIKPFTIKLGKTKSLINDDNQTVYYLSAESDDLLKFNKVVKKEFDKDGLDYSKKFKEFKPHVTVEYVDEGATSKHKKFKMKGNWEVDSVWLWGFGDPQVFVLG